MKKICMGFLLWVMQANAWDNHALLTDMALNGLPNIAQLPAVKVESLAQFLQAEQARLPELLEQEEKWARKHVPGYPPRPAALRFQPASNPAVIQHNFLQAIRINQRSKLALYWQLMPGKPRPKQGVLGHGDVAVLPDYVMPTEVFVALKSGQFVSPKTVLVAASDEPDYGLDWDIWEDSGTSFGAAYHFGRLPFGDPTLPFSSQAPFHMGFYHEDDIIYKVVPYLGRTLPEYRIHQFYTLARFAFATGHPYWGYRFAGWGLHYVQDLTQPYHATVAPGESVWKVLWVGVLDLIGIHGPKERLVQQVSDAHGAFENALYEWAVHILQHPNPQDSIYKALTDSTFDSRLAPYSLQYVRNTLTAQSHRYAAEAAAMVQHFPDKGGEKAEDAFYAKLGRHVGEHTRNWVRLFLQQK